MKSKTYREIEHTADVGMEVSGKTLEKLFINAANGFYSITGIPPGEASSAERYDLSLSESSKEELLVSFLNELNYLLMVQQIVITGFSSFKIYLDSPHWTLLCTGAVSRLSPQVYDQLQEIKSVTYHKIKIVHQKNGYTTQIFFDI